MGIHNHGYWLMAHVFAFLGVNYCMYMCTVCWYSEMTQVNLLKRVDDWYTRPHKYYWQRRLDEDLLMIWMFFVHIQETAGLEIIIQSILTIPLWLYGNMLTYW